MGQTCMFKLQFQFNTHVMSIMKLPLVKVVIIIFSLNMECDILIMNCGLNESSIVIPLDFIGNNRDLVKILQFFSPYLLVLSHRIPVTSRRVRMNYEHKPRCLTLQKHEVTLFTLATYLTIQIFRYPSMQNLINWLQVQISNAFAGKFYCSRGILVHQPLTLCFGSFTLCGLGRPHVLIGQQLQPFYLRQDGTRILSQQRPKKKKTSNRYSYSIKKL